MSYEAQRKLQLAGKIGVVTFQRLRTGSPYTQKFSPETPTKAAPSTLSMVEAQDTLKQAPTITTTINTHPFPGSPRPCTTRVARENRDVVASFPTTTPRLRPYGIVPLYQAAMDDNVLVVEVTVVATPSSESTPLLDALSASSIAPASSSESAALTRNATSSLQDAPSSFATLVKATTSETPPSSGNIFASSSLAATTFLTATATPHSASSKLASVPRWTLWSCLTLLALLALLCALSTIIYFQHVRGGLRVWRLARLHNTQHTDSAASSTARDRQDLTVPLPAGRYIHTNRNPDVCLQRQSDDSKSPPRLDGRLAPAAAGGAVAQRDPGRHPRPCLGEPRSRQDHSGADQPRSWDVSGVGTAHGACRPVVPASVYTSGCSGSPSLGSVTPRTMTGGLEDSGCLDDSTTNSQLRRRRHQHLRSPARHNTTLVTDVNSVDLESQTMHLQPRSGDQPTRTRSFDKNSRSFSGSALLGGLVDGLADKIIRFTNDDGMPEDGLLLPISARDRRGDEDIEAWN